MRSLFVLIGLCITCVGGALVHAQEGHPLKGSWIGTWGPSQAHSNDIVLVLDWDGKNVTGTINPGPDNMAVKNASLNPEGWLVHIEADGKDKSGAVINYVIDGKIDNLAFANRSITGTWKSQKEKGAFKVQRQ